MLGFCETVTLGAELGIELATVLGFGLGFHHPEGDTVTLALTLALVTALATVFGFGFHQGCDTVGVIVLATVFGFEFQLEIGETDGLTGELTLGLGFHQGFGTEAVGLGVKLATVLGFHDPDGDTVGRIELLGATVLINGCGGGPFRCRAFS